MLLLGTFVVPGTEETDDTLDAGKSRRSFSFGETGITGFSIICAWHFLVMFTAFPVVGGDAFAGRSLALQLAFIFACGVSYLVLALCANSLVQSLLYNSKKRWGITNLVSGALAAVTTLLIMPSQGMPFELQIVLWALMGLFDSFIIFPWLQLMKAENDQSGNFRTLVLNMGIGGLLAFILGNLQPMYAAIFIWLLPIAAAFTINIYRSEIVSDASENAEGQTSMPAPRMIDRIKKHVYYIVIGLVFGLCQAVYSNFGFDDHQITFLLNDAWPLLGTVIAAVILFFLPRAFYESRAASQLLRTAAPLLAAGIVLVTYFETVSGAIETSLYSGSYLVAQLIFMAGLTVFDFGFLSYSFSHAHRSSAELAVYSGFNRGIFFLSVGVGLAAGWCLDQALANAIPCWHLAFSCVVIVVLFAATLPIFEYVQESPTEQDTASKEQPQPLVAEPESPTFKPVDDTAPLLHVVAADAEEMQESLQPVDTQPQEDPEPEPPIITTADISAIVAKEYGLSKREHEVFTYLAEGHNAAYIQEELWISIHTVKTHIANIYHKLDVHSIKEVQKLVNEIRMREVL